MKTLTIQYDKLKIVGYLLLSIIFLIIFGIIMFNSEYLASKKPSSSGRNRWVGELFYENELLLFTFSFIINLLLLFLLIHLLKKLIIGKLILTKKNEIIFINGHFFIDITNIEKIKLFENNKNSSLVISVKNFKNVIENRNSKLDKIRLKIFSFLNYNKLSIVLTFLKDNSKNYNKIKSFIME